MSEQTTADGFILSASARIVAPVAIMICGGCGFYVLLSVIDEVRDARRGEVLMTTLLACAWFANRPPYRIAIDGAGHYAVLTAKSP